MPSPTKGVAVELDKERHLRYPLGTLREVSADADLVTVLYLGLKHEDGDLTPEQVGEMIDLEMLPELAEPLRKATGNLIDIDRMFYRNGVEPEGGAEGNATETPDEDG